MKKTAGFETEANDSEFKVTTGEKHTSYVPGQRLCFSRVVTTN